MSYTLRMDDITKEYFHILRKVLKEDWRADRKTYVEIQSRFKRLDDINRHLLQEQVIPQLLEMTPYLKNPAKIPYEIFGYANNGLKIHEKEQLYARIMHYLSETKNRLLTNLQIIWEHEHHHFPVHDVKTARRLKRNPLISKATVKPDGIEERLSQRTLTRKDMQYLSKHFRHADVYIDSNYCAIEVDMIYRKIRKEEK